MSTTIVFAALSTGPSSSAYAGRVVLSNTCTAGDRAPTGVGYGRLITVNNPVSLWTDALDPHPVIAVESTETEIIQPGGDITVQSRITVNPAAYAARERGHLTSWVFDVGGYTLDEAQTLWLEVALRSIVVSIEAPPGTDPVGDPTLTAASGGATAGWNGSTLSVAVDDIVVPFITKDTVANPIDPVTVIDVTWTVRDRGSPPGTWLITLGGPTTLTVDRTVSIVMPGFGRVAGGDATAQECGVDAVLTDTLVEAAPVTSIAPGSTGTTTTPPPTDLAVLGTTTAAVPTAVVAAPSFTG